MSMKPRTTCRQMLDAMAARLPVFEVIVPRYNKANIRVTNERRNFLTIQDADAFASTGKFCSGNVYGWDYESSKWTSTVADAERQKALA